MSWHQRLGRRDAAARTCSLAATLLAVVLLAGCSGNSGPGQYHVSGHVSFDGKPVPAGSVLFTPDRSKGNNGPAVAVRIKDGKYDTTDRGKATMGGPHRVTITGMDGKPSNDGDFPNGTVIFADYATAVDLPKSTAVQNFDVPAAAAPRLSAR